MKRLLVILLALPMLLIGGCKNLEPGGVYKDKILYDADMLISGSYEAVHTFVKWEYDNRELLKITPQVGEYANKIRRTYPQAHWSAIALRNSYEADPSTVNKTALQQSLDVLRAVIRETNKWLAFGTQNAVLEVK